MTTAVEEKKEAKQKELPQMPARSKLGQACDKFIEHRDEMSEAQEKMEKLKEQVMLQMKSEGRSAFAYSKDGDNYYFELKETVEKLAVRKQSEKGTA